jgi:hypothetical protein
MSILKKINFEAELVPPVQRQAADSGLVRELRRARSLQSRPVVFAWQIAASDVKLDDDTIAIRLGRRPGVQPN